jgi:hypothetical protein
VIASTPGATAYPRHHNIEPCTQRCEWKRSYDRCMSQCLDRSRSHPPYAEPYLPYDYQAQHRPHASSSRLGNHLLDLFLRFPSEMTSGLLGAIVLIIRGIIRTARRSHNLHVSEELHLRANALEHEAADLRAEARRREREM